MKTKDMKRNCLYTAGIRRTVWLAALLLLLPASAVLAQKVNQGVDTASLFAPGNFIYFGHYKHAVRLEEKSGGETYTDRGQVVEREAIETPIVWRTMGEEVSDGKITLLSDYVLDSRPYGTSGQKWGNSELLSWLNGTGSTDFTASFTATELGNVSENTIHAPAYDFSGVYDGGASSASSDTKFYIPWGTPNQPGTFADKNRVFWTIGSGITGDSITGNTKAAVLKGKNPAELSFIDYNVYYWLRPMIYNVANYTLLVKSDGDINFDASALSMGVRPMFKLDTANILFAAELKAQSDIDRVDQQIADNSGFYTDEDALPNGGTGRKKAFKLTLMNDVAGGPTISAQLDYDLDETAASVTDTVAVNPGERLGFRVTGVGGNADRLAYKIVSTSNELKHYGDTMSAFFDSIHIVADDIYTEKLSSGSDNENYGHLNSGSFYSAYVWAQKTHDTQSNEGSAPIPFTLKVLADNTAPTLSSGTAKRFSDNSAKVFFNIAETNQRGKFYYVVDPGTAPTSFNDFVLSTKTYFANAGLDSISLSFGDNNEHTIYIIAKDQVRNISNILSVTIPIYTPPYAPVGKPGMEANLSIGETVTFDADSIATDANSGDVLKINNIITPPNSAIATVALDPVSYILSVNGVTSGGTSVEVEVFDDSYEPSPLSCTVTITINVHEVAPEIGIDYVEELLEGFTANTEYSFNGGDPVVPESVSDSIREAWFGTTLSIVKVSEAGATYNSKAQLLDIPPRPPLPAVQAVNESIVNFKDGQIIGVNDSMEYKVADTPDVWTPVYPGERAISDLPPGNYLVRYKAIPGKSFTGEPKLLTVEWGMNLPSFARAVYLPTVPDVTSSPSPGVHYAPSTGDFGFSLKSDKPLKVTTNREFDGVKEHLKGTPNADGGYDYLLENVSGNVPVVVYITPAPMEGSEVIGKQSVWTHGGRIYVDVRRAETVSVYALDGRLVKQLQVPEGLTAIPVSGGIYVVLLRGGTRHKVMVR
ncbi:MAG: DUF6273 domain-containing protein [Tannerella sp.]|jgi:hypothetical protein|nr:DUF6273 domain-containing protein [Tannerella sp.]